MITYDIFLRKYKSLPEKTLNLNEEVLRIREKFGVSENEGTQLIMAKYIKKYELYEKVYGFYWHTICGKKLSYPMSKFIITLHNQAIRYDYMHSLEGDFNYDIEESKFEGIYLYKKAADAKSQYLFYSFVDDTLEDEKVKDYRTIL